jgi:hypothetical protein
MSEECGHFLRLANEYAAVRLTLDESGNGRRLQITSNKDSRDIFLDPVEIDLLRYANSTFFDLLADVAHDDKAIEGFAEMRRHRPVPD